MGMLTILYDGDVRNARMKTGAVGCELDCVFVSEDKKLECVGRFSSLPTQQRFSISESAGNVSEVSEALKRSLQTFHLNLGKLSGSMSTEDETFEVNRILEDDVRKGQSIFLISWKDTKTTQPLLYDAFTKDMKSIFKKEKTFTIVWKPTWMTFAELKDGCDEILGAYLLLKLYNWRPKD